MTTQMQSSMSVSPGASLKHILAALLLTSSPAFAAANICTITNFVKNANLVAMTACTNPADTKIIARTDTGGIDAQAQTIDTMKAELAKDLIEAGYRPIDGATFTK